MFRVDVHGAEIIEELAPLYHELHGHQVASVPQLCGLNPRSAPEAWATRRSRYLRWFESPSTFVVADDALAGYALVVVVDGYDGWGDGEPLGEVKDFVVASQSRHRGLGTALLDTAEARLVETGVYKYRLNVLHGNEAAARFYAARGLVPTATTFSRRLD